MLVAGNRLQLLSMLVISTLAFAPAYARHHERHTAQGHRASVNPSVDAPIIQCVAFAKQDAGIALSGNARDWWSNAAGVYDRGNKPEMGSVLSFRENGRMPLGHVAVVSGMEDSRTIVIDQSHWNSRGISRGVVVEDVSDDNDWSAVRVQLGQSAGFGSIYSTQGFIYPRPDPSAARLEASYEPRRETYAVIARFRRVRRGHSHNATEIAEAPDALRALDLTVRTQ